MSKNKPNKPLNIGRDNIKPSQKPMTQQEAAEVMANFYDTVANCFINLVAIQAKTTEILGKMAKTIGEISIDTNDAAYYAKQTALKNGAVNEAEIAEHEKGEIEDEDDTEDTPKAPDE